MAEASTYLGLKSRWQAEARSTRAVALLIWAVTVVLAPPAHPQAPTENQVKAAFLLNFTKFIDWQPSAFPEASSPLTICIFGEDPFSNALDDIVLGETVNGRKIQVRRLRDLPPPHTCQIAYLGSAVRDRTKLLRGLGAGVLTIGEGDSFVQDGGVISFVVENRKVRFDVNRMAAEAAELKLSSRLLSVARMVKE